MRHQALAGHWTKQQTQAQPLGGPVAPLSLKNTLPDAQSDEQVSGLDIVTSLKVLCYCLRLLCS